MPQNKFVHFPNRPAKLTAKFTRDEYQKLLDRIANAEKSKTSDKWLKLFADWNELESYIGSERARIHYDYSRHMDNKQFEIADKYFREKIRPVLIGPAHQMVKAVLDSKHLKSIAEHYGEQLIDVYKTALRPLDPINAKLRIKESLIEAKYDKLKAMAKIELDGEVITLAKASSLLESPSENIRREAFQASRNWFLAHRLELAKLYDQLVGIRAKMAGNLSYKNFTTMAYEERGRTDYSRHEVDRFRKLIKKYVVPINQQLAEQQAAALGKKMIRPWDIYDPRTSLPLNVVPVGGQLDRAQSLFSELSSRLGRHFSQMKQKGLIDLENRPAKETNPFCTSFSDSGEVAILCNSTGRAYDIETLTHESGHAFQVLESSPIEAVDLQWGTADLAEIPSTAMEFLCLPKIEHFFSEKNSKKFRLGRWAKSASVLCYVCMVDEFQHWVYDNPAASLNQRDEKWWELSQTYLAPVDYRGYEKYRNLRWYAQSHIFTAPFYYIDYALAETAAMQIAMIDTKDHKKAMDIYMELCRLGGTKSFLAALKHVGLRSPFDESLVKDLANHTVRVLKINR